MQWILKRDGEIYTKGCRPVSLSLTLGNNVEAVGAGVKAPIIIKNMRISQKVSALSSSKATQRARRLSRYLSGCLSLMSLVAMSSGAVFPGKNTALALPLASDEPIISQTASTASSSPTKINPVFNLNHVEGAGFTGVTSVDAFYPIVQTPGQNLFFAVGSLNMNNTGNLGGGLQSGYRTLLGEHIIWGLHGGVDVRSTAQNTFTQASVGSELIGNKWDIHLNANVPLGDTTQTSSLGDATGSTTGAPRFSGNELLLGSNNSIERSTAALTTVELNAGVQLLDLGEGSTLWGRGGLYYLGGAASSDTLGVRASLDHWPQNNIRLGLGVQHDSIFDTTVTMSANILLGAPSNRSASTEESLWARAGEPLMRTSTVLLEETVNVSGNGSNVVAINPATGQPYVFRHVDPALGTAGGDSTAESPLNTLANVVGQTEANANNIIYVRAGNAGGAVTIPNGVQVLSVGPLQQIETQLGTVALPDSGSGILPTVSGTVTIGSDTLLSGLAISNIGPSNITNNGISASGSNIVIEDNTIADAFRGIYLPDVDGDITIARNQIVGLSNDSIFFEDIESTDDTTITITDNTLSTTSGGRAIDFDAIAGAADITITNNNITTIEREGIYIGPITDNAVATVTISNNQLPSIGADGISFNGIRNSATATLTIDKNTITRAGTNENADGIILNNIAGTANVAATIENNTISNASENGVEIVRKGNANFCLALNNNEVTTPVIAGFNFESTANGGDFQILNLDSITTDNIGSFDPADIEMNAAFVNGTATVAPCP